MATWKKVIVSGSQAELAAVTASLGVLVGTNQSITTTQAGTFLTGSFTGSLTGTLTGTASYASQANSSSYALTATSASYASSSTSASYALSSSYALNSTNLNGQASSYYTNASNINAGTIGNAYLPAQINVTGVSASFTGSLTGALVGTASWATTAVNSTQLNGQAASYYTNASNINAGTIGNAYLPSQISVTGVTASINGNVTGNVTGNLTGTASYATLAANSTQLNGQAASYYTNASNINAGTIGNAYLPSAINVTSVTASFLGNLTGTASYASMALTASYALNVPVTASYSLTSSNIAPAITNNTDNRVLTATGGGTINGESNLTFDGTLLTVTGNTTITGDLTVAGTASFTNTDNLTIKDKFILINSGSSTLADSGWITQYNAAGSGSAFYLEAGSAGSTGTYGRFAVAYDAVGTSTALTADEFVVTAKSGIVAPSSNPTWGGSASGFGNVYVNTNTGDIFIYS